VHPLNPSWDAQWRAALDAVYAHAREGYPEEVCGLLYLPTGEGGLISVVRCENRQNALHREDPVAFPRDARTAYNFGPKDLFDLEKRLRSGAVKAIIYHSHVDVGAYFSDEDARAAAPDGELLYPVDYLVVDVRSGGVHESKLFRFSEKRFVEAGRYGA
jgi:adenylyltransferase/sulfurtransferase